MSVAGTAMLIQMTAGLEEAKMVVESFRSGAKRVGEAARSVEQGIDATSSILADIHKGLSAVVGALQEVRGLRQAVSDLERSLSERLDRIEKAHQDIVKTREEEKSGE